MLMRTAFISKLILLLSLIRVFLQLVLTIINREITMKNTTLLIVSEVIAIMHQEMPIFIVQITEIIN